MKNYCILWTDEDGQENFIILQGYWKVLLWFLRTAWRCTDIRIFVA